MRGHEEQQTFDPTRISASRVQAYRQCGVAFKLKYVDGIPEEVSGSAALFGSVVHDALEAWAPNRDQDLLPLMRQAWIKVTEGTAVRDFIAEYQHLSVAAIKQEHAIREAWRAKGKESKAPRMTKEWKESDVSRQIGSLMHRWVPILEARSPWRFKMDRDPLPGLYDESLVLARRYQARWGHLPNALHVEFGFDIPWRGFTLKGYIDEIELLMNRDTAEVIGIGIVDYKTYRKEPSPLKDYLQGVTYDIALRFLVESGHIQLPYPIDEYPLYVGFDFVRWDAGWKDADGFPHPPRRWFQFTSADHDRVERELNDYLSGVEGEHFSPAEKGRNPEFCPYPSQCCLRHTAAAGGAAQFVEVPQ